MDPPTTRARRGAHDPLERPVVVVVAQDADVDLAMRFPSPMIPQSRNAAARRQQASIMVSAPVRAMPHWAKAARTGWAAPCATPWSCDRWLCGVQLLDD